MNKVFYRQKNLQEMFQISIFPKTEISKIVQIFPRIPFNFLKPFFVSQSRWKILQILVNWFYLPSHLPSSFTIRKTAFSACVIYFSFFWMRFWFLNLDEKPSENKEGRNANPIKIFWLDTIGFCVEVDSSVGIKISSSISQSLEESKREHF